MRDGVPLPGVSPAAVLSQLAYRTFGPLRSDRVRVVLDYHGMAGHAAGPPEDAAARAGVSTRTVFSDVRIVRAAGTRLPLTPGLVTEATRRSLPTEDHLARFRLARTFGLPAPAVPEPPTPIPAGPSPSAAHAARSAVRLLAATGPLDLDTLLSAIARARRFRDRNALTAMDFSAALDAAGSTVGTDARWSAPPGVRAPDRHRFIVASAAHRELTRTEMIDILIGAGYSPGG